MEKQNVLILGAAGRDFHNFLTYCHIKVFKISVISKFKVCSIFSKVDKLVHFLLFSISDMWCFVTPILSASSLWDNPKSGLLFLTIFSTPSF